MDNSNLIPDKPLKLSGEHNIGHYFEVLDSLYYEWKGNPSLFMSQGKEQYKTVFNIVQEAKELTEAKKKKLIKLITTLRENGVVKVCHKTFLIKINLVAIEKNLDIDSKKLFWLKLKEDYIYFEHLLFYTLVLDYR